MYFSDFFSWQDRRTHLQLVYKSKSLKNKNFFNWYTIIFGRHYVIIDFFLLLQMRAECIFS